jgi:hypothetical protein
MPRPRVTSVAAALTFALLAGERPARGEPPPPVSAAPPPPAPPPPPVEGATLAPAQRGLEQDDEDGSRRWYGWQTLITDGAALGLAIGAVAVESNTAAVASLFSYLLGAPIVHWAHRRVGIGFASLGMRIASPFIGTLTGYALEMAISDSRGDFRGLGGAIVGLGLGFIVPVVIDPAVLAFEKKPRRDASGLDLGKLRVIGGSRGDGFVLGLGGSL